MSRNDSFSDITPNICKRPRESNSFTQRSAKMKYFKEVLNECGVRLMYDDQPNTIIQEQSLVIRDIDKKFSTNENVQEFLNGLKIHLEKNSYFRKALLATVLRKHGVEDVFNDTIKQDSFLRILLNVTNLQKEVIEILLEEVTTHASEDTNDTSFLRLLLNVMRYLPFIRESKALTDKLLDILEVSTFASQLEILNSIPEIIPDCQYDTTAKQLSKLLRDNVELTAAIVDCLNSLNLGKETRAEVQVHLLDRLSGKKSITVFPLILEFLISDCKQQKMDGIVLKCRDALDEIMLLESNDKDIDSQKIIIISKLQLLTSAKNLFEVFVNFLTNIKTLNSDYKPVDILLLMILHKTVSNRKRNVEMLFKKLVKTGNLKITHLENLFNKYILKELMNTYLNSIIDIASNLLKDKNTRCVEFSKNMYLLAFNNKHLNRTQRQDVLHNLILLSQCWESNDVTQVLKILIDLSKNEILKQHASQLTALLDKIDVCELNNVKQIFELLCSLVCSEDTDTGLKNELYILIRKQLSSSKRFLKQRGIIAAVIMAQYTVKTEEEQSEDLSLNDSLTINDLPNGNPREAAKLLQLTTVPCSNSPELLGLYYDQLANVITTTDRLDKYFVKWLYDCTTNDFLNKYVTDNTPDSIDEIELSPRYTLNTPEEVESVFYINIGELSLKPSQNNTSIVILAPIFRLLRLLHYKCNNGNLPTIDALLGSGVILPDVEDINKYSTDQLKHISDALFHCINWFRETINAFVSQQQKKLRRQVLSRLQNLVEIENILKNCMEQIPDHKLPLSYFYNLQSGKGSPVKTELKITRPRKKLKLDTTDIPSTTKSAVQPRRQKKSLKFNFEFRELDTDVLILLKYPLKFIDETEGLTQATQQTTIEITCFKFLLEDLSTKLDLLTKNKNLNMSNLSNVKSILLITDCVRLLPNINHKFLWIERRIAKLLKECDQVYDHPNLFTEESNNLKTTFSRVLENYSLIFNWDGFQNPKNLNLLRDSLKALRSDSSTQLQSANQLSKEYANTLSCFINQCLYLQPAVHLIKTMQALYLNNISNIDIKKKIATTSAKLLSRPWYDLQGNSDSGKEMFENLETLIQAYLDGASVKTIGGLIGTLQDQAQTLKTKDDHLPMLGSINKSNVHIFYRNLCIYLLERIKIEVFSLTNNEHLTLWRTVAVTLQGLMAVLKLHETRSNLIHFLKKSVGILKVFLSHGIPIVEITLKTKTDQVVEILKTLQTTTRFLHHLCCHSKIVKDTAMIAHIPAFRLTLETFIYRVKAALVANDCSAAFWMGNLKNKDLHGEDILSQSSVASDETNVNEEEEELPPEDSDDDDEQMEVDSNQETASEVFD